MALGLAGTDAGCGISGIDSLALICFLAGTVSLGVAVYWLD